MVDWSLEHVPPHSTPAPHVLEIGSGNGTLLFALHEAGYPPERLSGIDYSEDAVRLARAIGKSRAGGSGEIDEDEPHAQSDRITFNTCDFLRADVPLLYDMNRDGWDLVLDKGTFDAIALSEKDENGKNGADLYPSRLRDIVKPGGFFLITCASQEVWLSHVLTPRQSSLQFYGRGAAGEVRQSRHRIKISVRLAPASFRK